MIDSILSEHKKLKKSYDQGESPLLELRNISIECIEKLNEELDFVQYGRADEKEYIVYFNQHNKSRPVNKNLFINDSSLFEKQWNLFLESIDSEKHSCEMEVEEINRVIYSSIISFSVCFDVWKPKSRKTPGTHFEVLLGSVLKQFLLEYSREKFVSLPRQEEKVSTDIVFDLNGAGIVIPAKITTRERIVQPYAHQRILDSIFGEGRYKSILLCVSETQREDDKKIVNDICVPGTLKLFQEHLSKLSGLYYLDPPNRYMRKDIAGLITVGDYGKLLKIDLANLVN